MVVALPFWLTWQANLQFKKTTKPKKCCKDMEDLASDLVLDGCPALDK